MQPFLTVTGIAAPLPIANVDTDMILPARFLKTISRTGLGEGLLYALRIMPDGSENPDFILNRDPWRGASILVVLDNFGCGSSREHAPWALLDYGIRCIVAPDFADIFFCNCLKNGILPVKLEGRKVQQLLDIVSRPEDAEVTVDLERRLILTRQGQIAFCIDAVHRERLMAGADEIGLSLQHADAIADHERRCPADKAAAQRIAAALGA